MLQPALTFALLGSLVLAAPMPQEPAAPRAAAPEQAQLLVVFRGAGLDQSALRTPLDEVLPVPIERVVAGLQAQADQDQQAFAAFVAGLGGVVRHHYWIVNGCAITVPAAAVAQVQAHAAVERVWPDELRARTAGPIRTATDNSHHRTDAAQATGVLGAGVTVAIVDSGFDVSNNPQGRPHLMFFPNGSTAAPTTWGVGGSRIAATFQSGSLPVHQEDDHGTAVAGVASGADWSAATESDDGHAPRAAMTLWSVADQVGGTALTSSLIAAWQGVLAQRPQKRIVVASMSYEGSPDPVHPLSQAIDSVGAADVLVTISAGNNGVSTIDSQVVNNGLSIGAVSGSKVVAAFSARGPLNGTTRPFPDLVAHGVNVWMPWPENEAQFNVSSGTSFSAPQVAGAAVLYRGLSNENALVTRAAILATTESVAAQNPGLGRNDYGVGYLRSDKLVDVARGLRWLRSPRLYSAGITNYDMPVTSGVVYTVALAWERRFANLAAWSQMRLDVYNGATLLASSDQAVVPFERLTFTSPLTGTVQVRITALSIEDPVGGVPAVVLCPEAREAAMEWKPVSHAVHPGGRRFHAMAFAANIGKTVLYGGDRNGTLLADHWEFDGTSWVQKAITTPPARSRFGMAYDKLRNRVVLWGGFNANGDVWEYDGVAWSMIAAGGPTNRFGHAMCFDEARGTVVMFGGYAVGPGYLTDTWEWNGTAWSLIASAVAPIGRVNGTLAHDVANQRTVLIGGFGSSGVQAGTYLLGPAGWTLAAPAQSPPGTDSAAAAYDSSRKRVVLHGGLVAGLRVDSTWEWNGTTWTDRSRPEATRRLGRSDHAMAYDSTRRRVVRFGGTFGDTWASIYGPLHDTWQWDSTAPATATNYGIGCNGPGGMNQLTATSVPWLGGTFQGLGTGLPAPSYVAQVTSTTPTASLLSTVLPPALAGCYLWVQPDLVELVYAANGTAQSQFQIPYSIGLLGAFVYQQYVPIQTDAFLNPVLATSTNALKITVGLP
jgi:hypothetical protein